MTSSSAPLVPTKDPPLETEPKKKNNKHDQEKWKKDLFERVKKEIYNDIEWDLFSKQVDHFVYVFGGGLYKEKKIPPHGRNEIWMPPLLEREIMNQFKQAMEKDKQ